MKSLGGDIYRHLSLIHAVALRLPTRRLPRLAALPFVAHLSQDWQVKPEDAFTVGHSTADIAYQYGYTGLGVTVAVVDSGIYPHPDLYDPATGRWRILAQVNFVSTALNANDQYGHGTHVAGIIAGNGASSTGSNYYRTFYGIARRANLVNVRVLDANGNGSASAVIAGIQWVVRYKTTYNIRVINLSLGHPVTEHYTTDPLCQAVEQAWKAGIVVVCAAGNDGRLYPAPVAGANNEGYGTSYGTIYSPGNDPYVISVGAMKNYNGTRAYDRIATYSSRGPALLDWVVKPDLVTPGNQVISLRCPNSTLGVTEANHIVSPSYYMIHPTVLSSSAYFEMSGTSLAAPVVSGAVALLLQANPYLSPDTIKVRLLVSATRWRFPDGTADACTFGAGYLYIMGALACRSVATGYALSPTLTRDSQGNITLNANMAIWGTTAIWGTQTTWGTQALWTDYHQTWRESKASALPILENEQ
ncbi:MAG TPA: S8 family peptidase [Chthonomonadaceae bacterium]|nr:S8 family peptidase [Chthonomonadaceae bacterium]